MIIRTIFETFLFYSLIFCSGIYLCIYLYFKFSYTYWARKGVPYLKPTFPLGNNDCLSGEALSYGIEAVGWYNEFKRRGVKIGGIYTWAKPIITLTDPEYIRDVLVKDFTVFVNREFYSNPKHDPQNESLFVVKGNEWKNTRSKISPYFTSAKIKMMFNAMVKNSELLLEELGKVADNDGEIDIKEILYDWTMDNIGTLFFGLDFDCLKDKQSKFRVNGRRTLRVPLKRKPIVIFSRLSENLAKFLGMRTFPVRTTNCFSYAVRKNAEFRKKNNIVRQDYLQLLMNYHESEEGRRNAFDINKVVANEILMFNAGKKFKITITKMRLVRRQYDIQDGRDNQFKFNVLGFDTSATTIAFALYELTQQPDLLKRAQDEVKSVLKKYDGKICYEAVMEMTYLKQVTDETLRMYPPLPAISRVNTKPYTFENTNITIPKDTTIVISLVALHRDPEHYANPDLFDPERFNAENRSKINPYVYIPFGEGPRNCVGGRFGITQAVAGLALILEKFSMTSSPRTCNPVPLRHGTFTTQSVKPLIVKVQRI